MSSAEHWQTRAVGIARSALPNKAYQSLAVRMACSTERAADYIQQAPVLVLAAAHSSWGDYSDRTISNHIVGVFAERVKRGMRLRQLMGEYQLAYPLRALRSTAIAPSRAGAIRDLSACATLSSSALAQAIPERPVAQGLWLGAILAWCGRVANREHDRSMGLAWIAAAYSSALACGEDEPQMVTVVADLFTSPMVTFDPKWTFTQAVAAADRWHATISKAVLSKGFHERFGVGFSDRIAYAPLPTETQVDGLDFVALDCGEALAEEGAAMRHCVGTYAGEVIRGWSRIYSIRCNGKRLATLELSSNGFDTSGSATGYTVRQLRGPCNQNASAAVQAAVPPFLEKCRALGGFRMMSWARAA